MDVYKYMKSTISNFEKIVNANVILEIFKNFHKINCPISTIVRPLQRFKKQAT